MSKTLLSFLITVGIFMAIAGIMALTIHAPKVLAIIVSIGYLVWVWKIVYLLLQGR